jgi:hypothetical protein
MSINPQWKSSKCMFPQKEKQRSKPQPMGRSNCRGHNELLLLVDDEQTIRLAGKQTLELFGYRVLLAANGSEALQVYLANRGEYRSSSRTWACLLWRCRAGGRVEENQRGGANPGLERR